MAIRGAADVPFFLIGGYDLLGTLTEIEDTHEAILEESHALGDSWVEHLYTNVRRGEITQRGFFDDAARSVHEALTTGPGQSRVLCYGLEGTATGAQFVGYSGAMQFDFAWQLSRGALHKARATYRGNGRIDTGRVLYPHNIATASGGVQSNALDNVVSTTNGGRAYFQLSAFSSGVSATGVQVLVQHSSDNVTYATLVTFASATAAPAAEATAIAAGAVIERYTRMNSSFTGALGGGGNASARIFCGIARY